MEASDDRRGALIVVGDGVQALADLLQVWWVVHEKALRGPGVGEDRRQRLIDFVGEGHRQLAGERHAIAVRQGALLLADLQVGASCGR